MDPYVLSKKAFDLRKGKTIHGNKTSNRPQTGSTDSKMKVDSRKDNNVEPAPIIDAKNQCVQSPTRKFIAPVAYETINEFDLDQVLEWNVETIRRYKMYIRRFENQAVLLNLLLLDKQLQDLRNNYDHYRTIR